jgi:hypothetical protein
MRIWIRMIETRCGIIWKWALKLLKRFEVLNRIKCQPQIALRTTNTYFISVILLAVQ